MAWWYPIILTLSVIILGILALLVKRWYVLVLGMSIPLGLVTVDYVLDTFNANPTLRFLAYLVGGILLIIAGVRFDRRTMRKKKERVKRV